MRRSTRTPLYQHTPTALLRAASAPLTQAPAIWPDPSDSRAVRAWLVRTWTDPDTAEAIRVASPALADRLDATMRTSGELTAKQLRRLAQSTARYLLRATGRPTPFGLFAGIAPVTVADTTQVAFTDRHCSTAHVDAQWLADITTQLETIPALLDRLPVVFTNLAIRRGHHLQAPHGPNRVAIRHTSAVAAVQEAAASPLPLRTLADKLGSLFSTVSPGTVHTMLTELVRQGFLITSLRAPLTVADPLAHLIGRLYEAGADALPEAVGLLDELEAVRAAVHRHDHAPAGEQHRIRADLTGRMRRVSKAGRTPVGVGLRLGCEVHIPRRVAHEAERAASALLRLTREPTGTAAWGDWYTAFCERYGTGTQVPVTEAVHPDAGLGFPAGYPGSTHPRPRPVFTARDERLAALAWRAMADGSRQITLTDEEVDTLAGGLLDEQYIPPHVEISARIHATTANAVDRGDFTLTVAPGRSAGTFTARFADASSELAQVYATVPTITDGALPAQLSTPPVYPHAQNICRTPAFLPHVIPLGEHRDPTDDAEVIELEDLALTATRERLHLVSVSRRRVIEPQTFHALAIEKQLVPLARFLTQVPRAGLASWTEFDWGPHARLPFLPRVHYHRSILSPAQWRLTTDDLATSGPEDWHQTLTAWRAQWHCPAHVELRDDDRHLRLDLDVPLHTALIHTHLKRHGTAILTESADNADTLGWIDGHTHEIALPLVAARPPAPDPLTGPLPLVTNQRQGKTPMSAGSRWLNAKIPTHPEQMGEIIAHRLPDLLDVLGEETAYWFVRYRSAHEPDHLRLRIRTRDGSDTAAYAQALAQWSDQLRADHWAGPLTLEPYRPETGRYGTGAALEAAEAVFAADSAAVAAQLRHLPATTMDPIAFTTWGMTDTVRGFLGPDKAMQWLANRHAPKGKPADRATADEAIRLAQHTTPEALPSPVAAAWRARTASLTAYAAVLPEDMDTDAVLESLLHMHHNRARGIDRDGEAVCRRLARQAALAWKHRKDGGAR
ncbi:lantibiotic dehydratase [Streptomyces sp. NA02950]|uniref:lantibiotic dehydratase n=1 Tax=Streptomyces sp. NA02950 TaxID=2742137 RepID=UPI00159016B0|nr:lantibiotic dehydratase [Streptomyces sp. NA02950]QKV90431.1 lantibiotic dehydratase [Streptomyces sp. NA02950]QKV97236.1 lantibiotic dehydratase [Streptomyces sp. NA02950]